MFQAKLRGWRRLAAGLVLVPGLTTFGADALGLLGRTVGQDRPAAGSNGEQAKDLMRQAREAYDAQNYGRARELAEKARSLRAPMAFYDDSPDDLLADVSRKSGGRKTEKTAPETTDPKALVEMAKQAYSVGELERAQDLAKKAIAHGSGVRWGLFDDTPSSVLKDIQKAKARRDKDAAERFMGEARALYQKTAATKSERSTNLTTAEEKAIQSAKLHGEYSMWDFGDRPTDLIADIKKARDREKLGPSRPMPARSNSDTEIAKAPNKMPAVGDSAASSADAMARKKKAVGLMQEGNALRVAGNYVEARQKFEEADRLNAWFSKDDENPKTYLAQLNVVAQRKINALTTEAKNCMARNEDAACKAKLQEAHQIATGMNLDTLEILELRASIKSTGPEPTQIIRTGINIGDDKTDIKPPPPAKPPVTDEPPYAPVTPIIRNGSPDDKAPAVRPTDALPPVKIDAPPAVKLPADPGLDAKVSEVIKPPMAVDRGPDLLQQARTEFKSENLEGARKLVTEILSGPHSKKDEAAALLTSIDTKENDNKITTAKRAFKSGMELFHNHNYPQALVVFNEIDGMLLSVAERKTLKEMVTTASVKQKELTESTTAKTGDVKKPVVDEIPGSPVPTPRVGTDLLKQRDALAQVEFQKLRSKSMKIESDATARFGRGETDQALQDLQNFVAEVKGTSLDQSKQNLLIRPIEARMDRLRILKHQTDFLTKESRDRRNFKSEMAQEALTTEKKKEEIAGLMKQANKLMDEGKPKEAYAKYQMANSLDPNDAAINGAMTMAERLRRIQQVKRSDESQEKFNWERMDEWHQYPGVTDRDPLVITKDKEHLQQMRSRSSANSSFMRSRSEAEKSIERQLSTPLSVNFKDKSLEEVIEHLHTMTSINFNLDVTGLKEASVDPKMPISAKLNNVSLKSALNIICEQAKLKHVIENETIRVTTPKNASGRHITRTMSVSDLVVPTIHANSKAGLPLMESLRIAREHAYNPNRGASTGTSEMRTMPGGLDSGTGVGLDSAGGRLRNLSADGSGNMIGSPGGNPTRTLEKELVRLITQTIKPDSWREMGGDGTIEYYPLGLALVINQAPEVIEDVERLLESLRKVQDLEVSIEVKVVSLGETFYERIGVDFAMGVRTNAKPTLGIPPGATTAGPLNRNFSGNVIGLQTPGIPTPDLDIPIRATSFGRAVPPFGGFGNSFNDGGIALGLAFLSDIQVQMFLEAAQGDTRTNVMQAPKVTAMNGTAAKITVGDYQFFMTGITAVSVNGTMVFVPQNVPYAIGIGQPLPPNASIQNGLVNFTPTQPQTPGLDLNVQPVVSADRRFVRLNISQSFTNLISGTTQIPVTTIVQAQFSNGGLGQPQPFTQFLQQPRFSNLETDTTVVVPDGGTVVMGGLKYMTEGRNEFGPPVLSKIPYLNRLFKNVAYGREGRSILIMVTPRVIINREEQERQTGIKEDDPNGFFGIAP